MSNNHKAADQETQAAYKANPAESQSHEMLNEASIISKLAALPSMQYDRTRKEEAEKLGILVSTLDLLVKNFRERVSEENNTLISFDIEPWPDAVNGDELLSSLSNIIREYIILGEHEIIAVTLWIIFTYFIEFSHIAPILNINSPEKRCGKSRLASILDLLVKKPISAANITPAALFRVIEISKPTLLLDESDTFILNEKTELRGIINAGHTRNSAFVIRNIGKKHIPKRFTTWCAKCLIGIRNLPDTIRDRSIIIRLRRKYKKEIVNNIYLADKSIFNQLQSQCLRFTEDNINTFCELEPIIPAELNDRAADNWTPLLKISMLAGESWLEIAIKASIAISEKDETDTPSIELLHNIKSIFENQKIQRVSTGDLIKALCTDKECLWSTYNQGKPITPRQLADMLREFNIRSKDVRLTPGAKGKKLKGYTYDTFEDAFLRYTSVSVSEESATPRHHDIIHEKPTEKIAEETSCLGVSDKNPHTDEEI